MENKPKLRFPEFSDSWRNHSIEEYIQEFSKKSKIENEYTVLSSTTNGMEVRNGRVSGTSNIGYKVIDNYDLVLSPQNLWMGNININRIGTGLVSPSYKTFKIHDLNIDFLEPQLKTAKMLNEYALASTQGASTVRRNLEIDQFLIIPIFIPTLSEQHKIASFFTEIDNVIHCITEEIRLWEEKKKGVMQKIFSQQVRFKNENGEEYPEWEEKKLGDVTFIKLGEKPNIIYANNNKYEYINAGTTNSGYTEKSNCKGDTVTTPSRGQGGIGYVAYQNKDFWVGPLCYNIRSSVDDVLTKYIYHYLWFNNYLIKNLIKTGSIPAVNRIDLIEIMIEFPCIEEQQKIADCLSAIDEVISLKKQKLETWKQIKKGLLQQMFI